MLEGLVASLLNRFLGMYVRNFDPGQLKVGIWGGDVKLKNLELRREALDQLKLPLNVVAGHLGQLTLTIPWSNLRGQPVKVFIEDVYLLASPKEDAEYDEEDEERRKQAIKIEKLDSAEMLKERNQEGLSEEESKKSQSFTDSLVSTIVNNVQVSVKNIHVRYEDSISTPGHPFALGLTLKEFSAVSTDGDWNPTYIQNAKGIAHKLASLEALAVYWNTDSTLMGPGRQIAVEGTHVATHDEMLRQFQDMIAKGEDSDHAGHQFILKPVSGKAKIELNNSEKLDAPKLKAGLIFDEIGLVLDDTQYRDALMMVDLFHYFVRHQEYKKLQPKGKTPKEDPKAWFRFAGNAVLIKIHERNRRWSWDYFKERRDDRLQYIKLFKKKKTGAALLVTETEQLNKLEWKLSYEDLRFWRSLARNQMKKENVGIKKATPKQQQGWISWAFGAKPQQTEVHENDESTTMTEEDRQKLYAAIDFDEKTAIAQSVDLPRERVKFQINANLNIGSFSLKRDIHNTSIEVLSLYFDSFKAEVLQRTDSFLADISLGGLRVDDGTTANSLYKRMVSVKDSPEPVHQRITDVTDLVTDPLFQLQFEQNPLDESADIAVTAKLKAMEIIYNPNFVVGIVDFLKPPERHMDTIYALMDSAGATVESIRQQTRAGLEFALEEHHTINAKLDLQAPLIIVPQDVSIEKSPCLILDAGHISVRSELIDKKTLNDIQSKHKQTYTEDDYKHLEGLMYDKFLLDLKATQVLIGPSMEETKAKLMDDDDKFLHIVDRVNLQFVVAISIVPKANNVPKMKISGMLPVLHASVSDKKYKSFMGILNSAIPKFDDANVAAEKQPTAVAARTSKTTKRPRAKSSLSQRRGSNTRPTSGPFAFTTLTEAIILEDSDDDDDEDAEFQDASNGETAADRTLTQRQFQLSFNIDKLQGSLYQSDPEGLKPDRLLVELVAEKFHVGVCVRPFDMSVDVSLQSVVLDDHVEQNPLPEFKRLVSSGDTDSDEKALIQVKFIRISRMSPEFQTVYQGIETNLDVAISTINLIVTRKTLLTLLDFILLTFTNPEQSNVSSDMLTAETGEDDDRSVMQQATTNSSADPEKIRIQINLKKISLVLNNDGIRIATLTLTTADLGIFLDGRNMRIGGKLGDLSLLDDVDQGAPREMRELVSIQGKELADFSYETFDAENKKSYPGYDSSISLQAGSLKVNFISEPFRKIIDFLVKFGRMQALFNAARQAAANQASQIQQSTARTRFDVTIKTPIIVFPRTTIDGSRKKDLIVAYLGEIYAQNKFVPIDDSERSPIAMKLSTGIRNIRLTSEFFFDNKPEELEMIHQVDLGFDITYLEHQQGSKRPDLEIVGNMTDFKFRVSQTQLRFLLELSRAVPSAFGGDENEEAITVQDVPREVSQHVKQAELVKHEENDHGKAKSDAKVDLGPELKSKPGVWSKLDLVFKVHEIGLELINATEEKPICDLSQASLSKFSLDDTVIKLRMVSDNSLEAELTINAFTITDSRVRSVNKFRKIMTSINSNVQQFMASVAISGGENRALVAMIDIDSPRIFFALDFLFAIQTFVTEGMKVDESPLSQQLIEDESSEESDTPSLNSMVLSRPQKTELAPIDTTATEDTTATDSTAMSITFRINIVDAQIILIANPLSASSEAIVLGTKQILMAQQHALTVQISEMGMFLCRMDKFENTRLRILDDFSLTMSMDSSQPDLSSLHVDIEPLVLRLSLRDILLAVQIASKASELSGHSDGDKDNENASEEKAKQLTNNDDSLKQRTGSGRGASVAAKSKKPAATASSQLRGEAAPSTEPIVNRREELTLTLDGIRVVLIGDLHELPMLDLSVKNFTVSANDWSSKMNANAEIHMFMNIYNFSKSSWEPLVEPWTVRFNVQKYLHPQCFAIEVSSEKMLDITITSATIALASKANEFLSGDTDVLSKPRGVDAPYKIRNYTGFDINVWADTSGIDDSENMAAKLNDGEEIPWRFEDWAKMRENLSAAESGSGVVGVKLDGSGFDTINKIAVNREGEYLYSLRPRKDNILHRLLVEVKLGTDNVKYVTFRSPLLVENNTQIPVEIGVFDAQDGTLLKIEKIAPGEARPAPVGAAFLKSLVIRPDQGFGYAWSNESLWWKDLLKRQALTMTCKGESGDKTPPFYFQVNASHDKTNPLTRVYPYMRIKLSAPIELENLLPYDFKYRIYDKNTKKDWTNFLRKGGLSPVHVVELSHLLLLSIDMQDTPFKQSEFAIINSNNQEEFRKETSIICKDSEGLALNLRIHYFKIPNSGGAFRCTVYSPYVILNKIGLPINVKAKSLLQQAQTAAGQGFQASSPQTAEQKAVPYMFAFAKDDQRNRVLLKVGDSAWSKPQSFDAIGSTIDVVLPSVKPVAKSDAEIHIGITIASGEGKYKLTKVITLAPRFVLKNKMTEDINIREPGSSELMTLKPNDLKALHFLHKSNVKQLCLCFPGLNNQWSSPFTISDLGTTHVKIARSGQRQQLVKVDILMEDATLFLHLSIERRNWPFKMRNESNTEFMFWQANPNVDDDDQEDRSGWKPIRYRLPPRSIMPYAWDYPAAKRKEIVLNVNGKERHVKLAEIGNLIPLKVPDGQNTGAKKIIDLNIAADGPTQTLILSNFKQSKSLYKQKSGPATGSRTSISGSSGFEPKRLDTDITFRVDLKLSGIGISLINATFRELAYVTFRDLAFQYAESTLYQTVTASIKWIQVDNQLYGGIFPMVLYPSVVQKTDKDTESRPSVHAQITRVKDESYGVQYIKYATVLLQQMTLEIDQDFAMALLEFSKVPGASWSEQHEGKLCDEEINIPEPKQEQSGQELYFELLNIQPMQLDLSFMPTEQVNVEDQTTSHNPVFFLINVLLMAVGNVNDAPVRLNSLVVENARVSTAVLMQNMIAHYRQEGLYQIHRIVGSADFLGNPVGLFNNLSSGVVDAFYEPYQGLIMSGENPENFGIGIAKGATSLVKKSVFGFSDSVSKVTGSMAKGLAAATMDKQFQDRRRMTRARNRPKHALYGVQVGASSFANSLFSGVSGIARKPLEGAEQEGVGGFFKGIGKGLVGVVTKPAIGVFDLASNVSEGIRNTTTVFDADGLDRVRLTRFIGIDGIVRPYNQREALGQFWLKQLDNGKYFNEDYLAHLELPGEDIVVMLTYSRILLIKSKKLTSEWDVPLKEVQTISKERTGLSLTLRGGTNGPFVPVVLESSRNFLYQKIGLAVGEFNRKFKQTE